MLRKHRIDVLKMPSTVTTAPPPTVAKENKYRQQAIDMLGKVFGTPETARRSLRPRSDDDDLTSEDSSTSFGGSDEGGRRLSRPRSATVTTGMQRRSTNSDSNLRNVRVTRTEKRDETKSEVAPPSSRPRAQSFDGGSVKSQEEESDDVVTTPSPTSESRPKSIDLTTKPKVRKLSDGQLRVDTKTDRTSQRSEAGVETKKQVNGTTQRDRGQRSAPTGSGKSDTSRTTSRTDSGTSAANRQRKKPTKTLPTPRPVSSKPSAALQHLAEQKRKEPETKKVEQAQTDGPEARQEDDNSAPLQNGSIDNEAGTGGPTDTQANSPSGPAIKEESPSKKKTLPSPAWSEHDDELSKDILVTQSEYVKEELIRLRQSLQQLEDRAENIETDIRHAMSEGDREQEENLMQEWFGILNKKNELIKRQMELNFVEKEEDLEKRQFFLNRELRPLMEIPEDEKTTVQKDREAHLLRELLELIDERDKLERKRMSTEKITRHERSGLAAAQAETANIVGTTGNTSGQSSKECIIQ